MRSSWNCGKVADGVPQSQHPGTGLNRRRQPFEGREQHQRAARKAASAAHKYLIYLKMVARDGIEPPTPAFSGPRSTTELPGLSEDFQLQFLRGLRLGRYLVGCSTYSALQRLRQYINLQSRKPTRPGLDAKRRPIWKTAGHILPLDYTGKQLCASHLPPPFASLRALS